jgi:hypothetical protein
MDFMGSNYAQPPPKATFFLQLLAALDLLTSNVIRLPSSPSPRVNPPTLNPQILPAQGRGFQSCEIGCHNTLANAAGTNRSTGVSE